MLADYLSSKAVYFISWIFFSIILFFLHFIFGINPLITTTIVITSFVTIVLVLIINYISIQNNYKTIKNKLYKVDKPELITYYLTRPRHYESGYIYDMLEQISHSLYSRYKRENDNQIEYQEYLQLFIHDLKLPIQNLKLTCNSEGMSQVLILEQLVDNLLNYSKISLNNIDLKIDKVELDHVLHEIIKSNFTQIYDKHIKLTTNITCITLRTDEYWLNFVLKQVIDNGIKYCDNQLLIGCYKYDNSVIIEISNDGALIRNDELSQVFDKGFVGTNSNSNATGYGLYYAKEVTNKLNCTIEVDTTNKLNNVIITFNI